MWILSRLEQRLLWGLFLPLTLVLPSSRGLILLAALWPLGLAFIWFAKHHFKLLTSGNTDQVRLAALVGGHCALMGAVIYGIYFAALLADEAGRSRTLLDSLHRSRMEAVLSEDYANITGGSDTVEVHGETYTVSWAVVNIDMDGDTFPDSVAKQVTVSLDGRALDAIVVDEAGDVGKI